jgi:hypothetical protein
LQLPVFTLGVHVQRWRPQRLDWAQGRAAWCRGGAGAGAAVLLAALLHWLAWRRSGRGRKPRLVKFVCVLAVVGMEKEVPAARRIRWRCKEVADSDAGRWAQRHAYERRRLLQFCS